METPKPEIIKVCGRCARSFSWGSYVRPLRPEDCEVVSPTGTGHWGGEYGVTTCGIDATGDRWWWCL